MDYPVLVRPGKPSWNMIPPQTTKVNAERLPIFEKRSRSGERMTGSSDSRPDLPPKEAYEEENQDGGIQACKTS